MEIKTCEQFVIAELEEARRKIEYLKRKVDERNETISRLLGDLNDLKGIIKYQEEKHQFYLSVWKKYDTREYATLCRVYGIVEQEEE